MRYTATQFADDLAQLMTHVGWPDAVVAGCSMGGCVAQAFAANYANRTKGACLIDTTAWRVNLRDYHPVARFGASFYTTCRERFAVEASAQQTNPNATAIDQL